MKDGEQSVIVAGIALILKWYAGSLDMQHDVSLLVHLSTLT